MPFILYVYLLLFTKLSLSKINAIQLLTSLLLKLEKVITLHKKKYMSLYNLVTDNFKEYDFDTEYCLYFVCESRDMSDESGTYIILLKLKTILFTWR